MKQKPDIIICQHCNAALVPGYSAWHHNHKQHPEFFGELPQKVKNNQMRYAHKLRETPTGT